MTLWNVWYVPPLGAGEPVYSAHYLKQDAEAHIARLLGHLSRQAFHAYPLTLPASEEEKRRYLKDASIAAHDTELLLFADEVWGALDRWGQFVRKWEKLGPLYGSVVVKEGSPQLGNAESKAQTLWKIWYLPPADQATPPKPVSSTHYFKKDAEAHIAQHLRRIIDAFGYHASWFDFYGSVSEENDYISDAIAAAWEATVLLQAGDVWSALNRWTQFTKEWKHLGYPLGAVLVEEVSPASLGSVSKPVLGSIPRTFWKIWFEDPEGEGPTFPATHYLEEDAKAHVTRLLRELTEGVDEYSRLFGGGADPSEQEIKYRDSAIAAAQDVRAYLDRKDVWEAFNRWSAFVEEWVDEYGVPFGVIAVEKCPVFP